ncbi:MAG: hypothetical protein ACRDQ4_09640 [Pseudonocardiaceae bacterium]
MERAWSGQLHTLAQLARRAGISEGRARGLAAKPSALPPPDSFDAGGRPLWLGATVDRWCASTGRVVNDGALWLFNVDEATSTSVELRRGLVKLERVWGEQERFFTIVWGTPRGHVIYLLAIDGGQHHDDLADVAAALIEPRWWPTAVVVMPFLESLPIINEPIADLYRLTTAPDRQNRRPRAAAVRSGGSPLSGLRRWMSPATHLDMDDEADGNEGRWATEAPPVSPRAEWVTSLTMEEISRPLGARLPVWIRGTLTEPHINRSLAYNGTFTVKDETTGWPKVQQRVERALEVGLPEQYPAAWAVLAGEANARLKEIREADAEVPDSGLGWYLVARPALPQVPLGLESRLGAIAPIEDPALVVADLIALREAAADLEVGDQLDDVYTEAIALLSLQLTRQTDDQRRGRVPSRVPVAELDAVLDQTLRSFCAPWEGPVIDEWKATLTPVEDVAVALRQRRVVELLGGDEPLDPSSVEAAYRDPEGRYVVILPACGDNPPSFVAEWPASLDAVAAWNDRTVLAADHAHQATAILALTPTDDGQMRVDPVPLRGPRAYGNAFAYGYGGGTPATTYTAILRCALPDKYQPVSLLFHRTSGDDGGRPMSQLWDAIATTKGPLRLHWSQVQQWARTDLATVKAAARPERAVR